MSLNPHNAKKPRAQHSTYLSGRDNSSYSNIARADRIHYEQAQEGCEELRRAMMRFYYKRNGVRL